MRTRTLKKDAALLLVCAFVSASLREQQAGGLCYLCVVVGVCARSSACICAQVADTLGKSFQIHLFRSLCAGDTCTMLPKKCHNVSDFVCSSDPPLYTPSCCVSANVHLFVCEHIYCMLRLYLCLVVFSVYLCWVALSNASHSERNSCVAFNDFCFKSGFTTELIKSL